MSEQEKKDKKFSIILSGVVHASILAIFFLLVAWRAPDPPIPEYGIELNFGFEEQGGGNTEREAEAKIEDNQEEEAPDAPEETEQHEEVVEEEISEETVEEVAEPEPQPEPVEETVEEVVEEVVETVEDPITTEESEVVVEEKVEPKVEKKEETPPVEEPEKKEEPKPEPKKPTIDNRAMMGGKKSDTEKKDPASNNQGDDRALMGNQGDPEGKKNTNGQSPGGADLGVSYSLDGWKWQQPPAEKDDSQIDGIIKFAIDVDDRGDVVRVTVIPGTTISDNTIVDFYKKQVQKLRFVQLDPTKAPASISKGEVTFVIKTN